MTLSDKYAKEIEALHKKQRAAEDVEARDRLAAIFGVIPGDITAGDEHDIGEVARVYCVRAYDEKRIVREAHEWIALWKKKSGMNFIEMRETAQDYISGGCVISG